MIPLILLSNQNLILQASLALSLTLILSLLNLSTLFLHGLHTYIHPDDVSPNNTQTQNGIRAAIRRPGAPDSDLRPRKKSKERFEFDENRAQIFRLRLNDSHLQTRVYFKQYRDAFNSAIVVFFCFILYQFRSGSGGSGVLGNGSVVPVLVGLGSVFRVLVSVARVSFEKSASKRSEKQLGVLFGILGFVSGLLIVHGIVPDRVLDFGFGSMDGYGRFWVAALMGLIAGFLFMPAAKNARSFWVGTDQIQANLSIISCGWFSKMLLSVNYVVIVFTSLLWINPWPQLLVKNSIGGDHGNAEELAGNVGMSRPDFERFRVWCLLVSGTLQLISLRPNLQMYLNEAVLSWYQRLHASKVPDLSFSRAKVFLHNHYFCLVVLQFFATPALVLLFLGLSQIDDSLLGSFQMVCGLLPCFALVKEVALLLAWWVVFVWSVFTSAFLVLYRRGVLYVS